MIGPSCLRTPRERGPRRSTYGHLTALEIGGSLMTNKPSTCESGLQVLSSDSRDPTAAGKASAYESESELPNSAGEAEILFGSHPSAPPGDHGATEPFGPGLPSLKILPFDSAVVGAPAEFIGEQQEHPVGQPFAALEEFEAALHIGLSGILDTACVDAPGHRRTNADDLSKFR